MPARPADVALVDPLLLHRFAPERYPFLIESVVTGPATARYTMVFAFPGESLTARSAKDGDFLRELDARWAQWDGPLETLPVPFRGGWFVYLGYELAGQVEPTLDLPAADAGLPMALAVRIPAAVVVDHQSGITWLVAEPGAEALVDVMAADLSEIAAHGLPVDNGAALAHVDEDDAAPYLEAVERIKRYIRDGDVFQVNLSRAWRARLADDVDPAALYQRLRRANPAPFAGLMCWGRGAIVSSSPERLISVRAGRADTRPIAGTRPRGAGDEDRRLSDELMGHPKERAEHVMLIDLERNDLGRVCRPGTVRVDELMVLESYAHVHHIVSNVSGQLRPEVKPGQAIRAVFPGGTITGCPKVRCMEILAELEQEGRGPYTGSFGYLNHDGDLDLNILIRTLAVYDRDLVLRAGGGIVADSIPERELAETRAKARGLLLALAGD